MVLKGSKSLGWWEEQLEKDPYLLNHDGCGLVFCSRLVHILKKNHLGIPKLS
jgi:hypothetical protein